MISESAAASFCNCDLAPRLASGQSRVCIQQAEQKTTDKQTFWLYLIELDGVVIKRRYSEFESFRSVLVKLYPSIFVPPIPGKHSLSDYAHVNSHSRHKDELAMIEKRKRMLERFLQRLLDHPVLSREHVIHQFLQPHILWPDLLAKPPLSTLKSPFAMDSVISSIPGSSYLLPSRSYTLKHPDPAYTQCETLLDKQLYQTGSRWDHAQKKLLRRLGDLANDHADLGAAYNGLSLDESGSLAPSIEQLGFQHDDTCLTIRDLVTQLERDFAEHVQEYVQYIDIAKSSIQYWYMTLAQLEMIGDALINKQTTLHTLIKTEDQAERLQQQQTDLSPSSSTATATTTATATSMSRENDTDDTTQHASYDNDDIDIDTRSIEDGFFAIDAPTSNGSTALDALDNATDSQEQYPPQVTASAIRASRSRSKKWTSPRKLLHAVSYTLHGMMDIDPGLTRRNQIGKLKEEIHQLEMAKAKTQQNIKQIQANIQSELVRFEKLKAVELKNMMIAFAKLHLSYCEKNMDHWTKNKKLLDQLPDNSSLISAAQHRNGMS